MAARAVTPDSRLATLAAQIVFSYLANHSVTTSEVPGVVQSVADALAELDAPPTNAFLSRPPSRPTPKKMGRPPNSETTPCKHCGRRFRDLEKHLWEAHGMDAERYRAWFSMAPKENER